MFRGEILSVTEYYRAHSVPAVFPGRRINGEKWEVEINRKDMLFIKKILVLEIHLKNIIRQNVENYTILEVHQSLINKSKNIETT